MQHQAAGLNLLGNSQRLAWPSRAVNPSTRGRQLVRAHRDRRCLTAPLTLASAVKEDRKSTSGRKGDSHTSSSRSTTTSSRTPSPPSSTTSGRNSHSTSSSRSPSPSPPARPPPQQRGSSKLSPQQQSSRLDAYIRKHPLFSRFYDTTLLLGDCVMILATESSSERIEWSSFPALVGVLLACWVTAGAINGDYSPGGTRAHEDVPWQLSMLGPTFGSVLGAALTWALASTAAAAAYAALVASNALDAAPVVEGLNSDDLSPQLEVVVALLITMTCWRGIVSKLRPTIF